MGKTNESSAKPDQQVFTPPDEAFEAAIADLMNEGARKLHEYPLWRNKFLAVMVKEFNGSHDQAMILSEMSAKLEQAMNEDGEEWGMVNETKAKASARPQTSGYRG